MKTRIATAIMAAAALGVAGSALAESSTVAAPGSAVVTSPYVQTRAFVVRFDADRIQTQDDAVKLFFLIRRAAEKVCAVESRPMGHQIFEQHACENQAVAAAVEEAKVPELTRYYLGVKGRVEVGEPS